jgi:hypothetical protein
LRAALGAACVLAVFLGACQTDEKPKGYLEFESPQDPVAVSGRIAENVGACWFRQNRTAFAGYSYTPELTSYSGRPRVLIVSASDPTGLPKLVIEATKNDRGTSVKLFGPMLGGANAPGIMRDVQRWTAGATDC